MNRALLGRDVSRRRPRQPRPSTPRVLAATALASALLLAGCAQESGAGTVVDQGFVSGDGSTTQWAPDERKEPVVVEGLDYDGNAVSTADWAGDVIVLNTWYAACAPCRAEAPDLVALAGDHADDGVRVLGINTQDDAGAAQAFERTFEVPYPSLPDDSGRIVARLSGIVQLQAVPTTVVLDRAHRPAARIIGQAEPSTLRALVDDVLAETATQSGTDADADAAAEVALGDAVR